MSIGSLTRVSGHRKAEHELTMLGIKGFYKFLLLVQLSTAKRKLSTAKLRTDISQKDEKPIKKRQNRTRDGKVCGDEAKSK
ncbi:hypothetical protein Tco_0863999 [Tanacetum coccineum]